MNIHRLAAPAAIMGAFVLFFQLSGLHHLGGGFLHPDPAEAFEPDLASYNFTGDICYSFEDGQLPPAFAIETVDSSPAFGRVLVGPAYPYSGSYALNLDTSCTGNCSANFSQQAAVVSQPLGGAEQIALSFWGRNHADEPHAQDGVFISDNGGDSYAKIFDIAQMAAGYQRVILDIDDLAAGAGLALNDQFRLKFQSYDNSALPADGYSFDDVCLCSEPSQPIPVSIQQIGGGYQVSWTPTGTPAVEIWYAANRPAFTPGTDCQNPPNGMACQLVSGGPTTTITDVIDHPEFSYTFLALARNSCGQRTPTALAKRKAVMKFGFSANFAPNLGVSLSAPQEVTFASPGELLVPISQTIVYTNHSQVYSAASPVLTYTMPAHFVLAGNPAYPWQQVGSSSIFTMSLPTLPPGGGGTAVIDMVVGERLAGTAVPVVAISSPGSPAADPVPQNNTATAQIALTAVPDGDGDKLPDWMENGSLVYSSPIAPGTDPWLADTDGDGIVDGDEVRGTALGLDLPAMGVHPLRKNILLEYDWLINTTDPACLGVSHRPSPAALQMVSAAFASSPVINPDGSTGIDIVHDYGQGGLFIGGNLIPDADGVIAGGVGGVDYAPMKAANFAAARQGYFHYVLLPHRFYTSSNSSGQAELPGDDMIVSLQCFGSDTNVAHTVMHELGHNLGLRHGGSIDTNRKPNYNSVMNYLYQFPGVDSDCTPPGNGLLNYSSGGRITLTESALNEQAGICGLQAAVPWDWNGNSLIESAVAVDVNSDGKIETLTDFNDWANLNFGLANNNGDILESPVLVMEDEVPEWAK